MNKKNFAVIIVTSCIAILSFQRIGLAYGGHTHANLTLETFNLIWGDTASYYQKHLLLESTAFFRTIC
jgi:hypothetical protein